MMKTSSTRIKSVPEEKPATAKIVLMEMLVLVGGFFFSAGSWNLVHVLGLDQNVAINVMFFTAGLTALVGVAVYSSVKKSKK